MDFARTRALFELPDGVVYLDGNSLGPLPKGAGARAAATIEREWGGLLIRAWNDAGWMDLPRRLGDRIAPLVGAPTGSIVVGDTLSIKVHQALAAALELRPDRRIILSDKGNFPSDLYMAEGLARSLGKGHRLRTVAPEALADAIDEDVAVVLATEVDYRTGRRHDMKTITARAHDAGALTVWDLAHSAGAIPVDLTGAGADFAVGCTYKFLNGGPGAPAFIHVRPDLVDGVRPALSGWLGHADPFAFEAQYRPAPGIERMRVGTPPVIQMAILDAALDVWDGVSMEAVAARSAELSARLVERVEAGAPEFVLASPRRAAERGSQLSFRHPEAYAICQALIARGVIGDFRAPDLLRLGITPLYIGEDEIDRAADTILAVMAGRLWDRPEYRIRRRVT